MGAVRSRPIRCSQLEARVLGPQLYVRNFIDDPATTPATNTTTQTTSPQNDEMSIRMACGDVVNNLAESRIAENCT